MLSRGKGVTTYELQLIELFVAAVMQLLRVYQGYAVNLCMFLFAYIFGSTLLYQVRKAGTEREEHKGCRQRNIFVSEHLSKIIRGRVGVVIWPSLSPRSFRFACEAHVICFFPYIYPLEFNTFRNVCRSRLPPLIFRQIFLTVYSVLPMVQGLSVPEIDLILASSSGFWSDP